MPWTCPECGREFHKANQQHSCLTVGLENHFDGKAETVKILYGKLLEMVSGFGDVRISSTQNAILFASKTTFMAVKTKRTALDVEFLLDHPEIEFPIHKTVTVSKNRFAHFVRIENEPDISPTLEAYLREAFETVNR